MSVYSERMRATPDLRAYWKMDEAAGDLLDASGRGHTAVAIAGPNVRAIAGARPTLGLAAGFRGYTGGNNRCEAADHADWSSMVSAGTIIYWAQTFGAGYGVLVAGSGAIADGGNRFAVWKDVGAAAHYVQWALSPAPNYYGTSTENGESNGAWHQVAFTWRDTGARVYLEKYVDAARVVATDAAWATGPRDIAGALAVGGAGGGYPVDSMNVQHLALVARVMSGAEILALYNELPLSAGLPDGFGGVW